MQGWQELPFHSLANIFPLLEGEDYKRLCEDIRSNGLLEPIWTYQGSVLDGRNRYRACQDTETEPRFREYEGDDPVAFVVSLNLHRRHLDESQRAMVAAKIATIQGRGRPVENASIEAISQSKAAELLNVSRPSVQRAAKVRSEGAQEVVEAVEQGRMPVSAAVPLVELPKDQQRETLASLLTEAAGGKVTGPRVEKAIKVLMGETNNIHVSDDSYEWYTPKKYIEAARKVMGEIDLDPASSQKAQTVVKASKFYSKEENGLHQKWTGRIWMNPPYSAALVTSFTEKLLQEFDSGNVTQAMVLVNNATDAAWFQSMLGRHLVCFTAGRVKFWTSDREDLATRQGQAIFYLGDAEERFKEVFSAFGTVVAPL